MKLLEKMKILMDEKKSSKSNILIFLFLAIGFCLFLYEINENQTPTSQVEDTPPIDTLIPEGYVLVPVKIQNSESLQNLISHKGIVDLFYNDGGRSIRVGTQLKIIQAPMNPEIYAVLVKENESSQIMKYPGPFTVVIQNQSSKKSSSFKPIKTNELQIQYSEGGPFETLL